MNIKKILIRLKLKAKLKIPNFNYFLFLFIFFFRSKMKTRSSGSNIQPAKERSLRKARAPKSKPKSIPKEPPKRKIATKFLALNDYCIDEICEWLPLDSLAALSMTSKRLQHICSGYFRRRHKANYVTLSSTNDGKIHLSPDQSYVRCFEQQFRSIVIYGIEMHLYDFIANTFKEKPVKKVNFYATKSLTEGHMQRIADILTSVEVIEFIRCTTVGSLYDLLKYCSNMKCLVLKSIDECTTQGQKHKWLLQKYLRLEHLHWEPQGIPTIFREFFTRNPTVKSVCGTDQMLAFIQANRIKLDVYVLKVTYRMTVDFFIRLRMVCSSQSIQSIFLMGDIVQNIDNVPINLVPVLHNVEGISSKAIEPRTIATFFPRLKWIQSEIKSGTHAKRFADQLKSIEEAFLDVSYLDYIIPLIRFAPKLRVIYINNTGAMKPGNKLSQLNLIKLREKLSNAENLMIYLKEEAYLKIKSMSICPGRELVQINSIATYVTNNVFINTILQN